MALWIDGWMEMYGLMDGDVWIDRSDLYGLMRRKIDGILDGLVSRWIVVWSRPSIQVRPELCFQPFNIYHNDPSVHLLFHPFIHQTIIPAPPPHSVNSSTRPSHPSIHPSIHPYIQHIICRTTQSSNDRVHHNLGDRVHHNTIQV